MSENNGAGAADKASKLPLRHCPHCDYRLDLLDADPETWYCSMCRKFVKPKAETADA